MTAFLALDWDFVADHMPDFLEGLRLTLGIAAASIAGSFVVGLVLGAGRAYRVPVVSQLAAVYVELIRNTPLLVQIFFVYYGLPHVPGGLDVRLEPATAGVVSLVVWGGAFNTENFRAGFEAVPRRYQEGAFALGFGRLATFFNITLPIGGRIALPSSINTYVAVLKNTSLLTAISVAELTNVAYDLESNFFKTAEVFFVIGAMYLVIVWALSAVIRALEARLALPDDRRVRRATRRRPIAEAA